MPRKTRNRILVATGALWCLSVLALETFRIWKVLSGPPQSEEYVNHLEFQLFASAFLVVTRWLPLLGGLLLLEFVGFSLLGVGRGKTRVPDIATLRFLIVVFGALPASILALSSAYGAVTSLASPVATGTLLAAWAFLGLAGVTGLWMAAIVGPGSRRAAWLVVCGLVAGAVPLWVGATLHTSVAALGSTALGRLYGVLLVGPFVVGGVYACHALIRVRRVSNDQHPAV